MQDIYQIESLDLEARGVSHRDGKVIFIDGALPGERVVAEPVRQRRSHETARTVSVLKASSQRVAPRCPHFGTCGGCAMQHLEPVAQVAVKQRVLEDAFGHIGGVKPACLLPPLHGPYWGYRYRARLTVRVVPKKGGVLVGFHERRSSYVADMRECHVLPPKISNLLLPLRALIGSLSIPTRLPQIEVALGESATVLVLRHLEPLLPSDLDTLRDFGAQHGVSWWLQSAGPDTVRPLDEADADILHYALPEFGLHMPFRPIDFTQVNPAINRVLVSRALALLAPTATDRVADLFCGLGNFTLPLATRCAEVVGVEGSATLTQRARDAAVRHGLAEHTSFATCNLFTVDEQWLRAQGRFDRMLVDPPREGAQAIAEALSRLLPEERPTRVVYVSCNPATLARDAAILVHQGGWRMAAAGVVNMFPHTAHVESIAVFEHDPASARVAPSAQELAQAAAEAAAAAAAAGDAATAA